MSVRRKVGFLPEHFRFYDWLTAAEFLKLHGRLYGMPHTALRERVPAMLEMVGLLPHQKKQLRNFSKGMLQRIGLAQALLNEPDLIFLDEPTSGLDPPGSPTRRDIIKAQRQRGATVLLNSHLLGEVEITCDRVAFIKNGEVIETRDLHDAGEQITSVSVRAANLTAETATGLSQWTSSFCSVRGRRPHISFALYWICCRKLCAISSPRVRTFTRSTPAAVSRSKSAAANRGQRRWRTVMGTWIMAGVTFREAARREMLWMALAAGAAFLTLFGITLHFQARDLAALRHGETPILRTSNPAGGMLTEGGDSTWWTCWPSS